MINLIYTPSESLRYYKEYYPNSYKDVLLPAIDLICMTAATKNINTETAAKICIAATIKIEEKTRIQAGYTLLIKTEIMSEKLLKQIQNEFTQYKTQLLGLDEAILSKSDTTTLRQFYQDKLTNLSKREKELLANIEVKGAVISTDQTNKNHEGKIEAAEGDGNS